MTTDSQTLLAQYIQHGSDEVFRELVARYVDFVYSTALRLVDGDNHRAEDVSQIVFVNLARQARTFSPEVKLGGWLHRHTCFVAANTMRGERRRQFRERQAVEMSALHDDSGTNFAAVAPLLDEAINELNETDREAILLRFFEQQDFRAVGKAIGQSEDAARMKVHRALDKLESLLKRRGLTTTAAALSVALSANTIQAAPAGLTAAISTAASLAATASTTTTTITTAKTIAMTTMQKTLITASIAIAVGTGIYEANKASRLQRELHASAKQQAALTAEVERLSREHSKATNQLSAASAEVALLKSGQNQNELLKLRGQVGVLRQQLVSAEAKSNLTGLEKIMADPVAKEMTIQSSRREIKLRYAELFQELKLSPEQIETFGQTVANSGLGLGENQGKLTSEEVNSRLRSLLGEDGYARYQEFTEEVPIRATLKLLKSQLGANQLTEEQSSRLWQIIKAEPFDLTYGIEGDIPMAVQQGSLDEVDRYMKHVADFNQRIAQQAAAFLAPDQMTALNTVLTNALKMRAAQAAVFQKR